MFQIFSFIVCSLLSLMVGGYLGFSLGRWITLKVAKTVMESQAAQAPNAQSFAYKKVREELEKNGDIKKFVEDKIEELAQRMGNITQDHLEGEITEEVEEFLK